MREVSWSGCHWTNGPFLKAFVSSSRALLSYILCLLHVLCLVTHPWTLTLLQSNGRSSRACARTLAGARTSVPRALGRGGHPSPMPLEHFSFRIDFQQV